METTGVYRPLHEDVWIEEHSSVPDDGSSGFWEFDLDQWIYRRSVAPGTGPDDQIYQKIYEDGKGNSYWRKKAWLHIHT